MILKRHLKLFISFLFFLFTMNTIATDDKAIAQTNAPPYRIGPSDILNIYVWKEPELTQDVTVLPDGNITMPLIGEVKARGKTAGELRAIISEKLKDYVTEPEVTVIVRQTLSRKIYTVGKLNTPGPYPLEPEMTVLQAISTARGFSEWAKKKDIVIIRKEGGKEVQFRFNYEEYISGKNLKQNILLKPNDTIVVP
jgi:polysaccharide export outer membrane protein